MYSEREYLRVKRKSLEHKGLVDKWDKRASGMLTSTGISVVLYIGLMAIGGFHPFVMAFSIVVTTGWFGAYVFCKLKANAYHVKRAVNEAYLGKHKYDFNIDKRINKEI